jgi:hypothetical protein
MVPFSGAEWSAPGFTTPPAMPTILPQRPSGPGLTPRRWP